MHPIRDFGLGLKLVIPQPYIDDRGEFYESYNKNWFPEIDFVQANHVTSKCGVIRGLHYQAITPTSYGQIKLVRVTKGLIIDVAVDIQRESPTFGKWASIRLSSANKYQLLIPLGFAHGYRVLSEDAEVQYLCSNFYNQETESGIKWNDPDLQIGWEIPYKDDKHVITSKRDEEAESFKTYINSGKRAI